MKRNTIIKSNFFGLNDNIQQLTPNQGAVVH